LVLVNTIAIFFAIMLGSSRILTNYSKTVLRELSFNA